MTADHKNDMGASIINIANIINVDIARDKKDNLILFILVKDSLNTYIYYII